ncbi:MAG: hypothetical protein ABI651_20955 [Verrucomicrobiota bacterium]
MNMELEEDDLAALCAGMTTKEVDRVHRLLHQWNVGPDSSFPVQLTLLTRAQWHIAANLPRLMDHSRYSRLVLDSASAIIGFIDVDVCLLAQSR